MFILTFMNAYGIIFSSYKYHRCTVQNEIWMRVSVLCQRYTRYTGEITWKTTSKTTESTSQNNRLFLKTNPLLLLQKQKQELLQRQQRKLSRKKIFLLVRRASRPEREAFFSWTGWFLSRDGWLYRRLLRYLGVHPLSFAFAQQLPQRWSRGRCAPGVYAHLGTGWNPGLRADAIRPLVQVGKLVTFNQDVPGLQHRFCHEP